MSLLPALNVKNCNILQGVLLFSLKKRLILNLKNSQNEIWTSAKRSRKQLSSKINFSAFFKLFALFVAQNCVKGLRLGTIFPNKLNLKGHGQVRNKKLFLETIIHKVFAADSSFHVKWRTTGKVQFLFFRSFLLVLTKFLFGERLSTRQ